MDIQLHQLVEISNNSIVTQAVLEAINQRLEPQEKRDFVRWLQIIKQNRPR